MSKIMIAMALMLVTATAWGGEYEPRGNAVELTAPGDFFLAAQWSPDGHQLAAAGPGYNGLFLIEFPTGNSQTLNTGLSAGYGFAWSHDGSRIAARISRYEGMRRYHSLVSIDISNGRVETWLGERPNMPGKPLWSQDDTRLSLDFADSFQAVDSQGRTLPTPDTDIVFVQNGNLMFKAAGVETGQRLSPEADRVTSYALSPDGTRVVYSTSGQILWLSDIPADTRRSLGQGIAPSWAPTGDWITFMLTEDDGHDMLNSEIYILAIKDGQRINITRTPQRLEMNPQWSPDGSWIVYDTERQGQLYLQQMMWR